jgi:hypothetical protein
MIGSAAGPERGLVESWWHDGPGLLILTALGLIGAGLFAWFLALTGQLLPHDVAELRSLAGGRVVHFMAHDRAAFGGTLIAVGVLYAWLVRFPLVAGEAWAWWVLALGGGYGFLTFLTFLGTGYLDSWHALAAVALLPPFVRGLVLTRSVGGAGMSGWRSLAVTGSDLSRWSAPWYGRGLLLLTALGMVAAGLTIVTIGTFVVFVPHDLAFIGIDRAGMDAIDARLVPLIAHDRAGFGASLGVAGLTVLGVVWCGRPSRSRWEALFIGGVAGFGAAVGVHEFIGYIDPTHVGPAMLAAVIFGAGMALSRPTVARPPLRSARPIS